LGSKFLFTDFEPTPDLNQLIAYQKLQEHVCDCHCCSDHSLVFVSVFYGLISLESKSLKSFEIKRRSQAFQGTVLAIIPLRNEPVI
jgi:hypothetical protein